MRVALIRCRVLPEPDPDEAPLSAALRARGIDAEAPAWDDPAVDWDAFDANVLRATWNYPAAPDAFLSWAARVPRLFNPLPVVRWNLHKRYLRDLPVPAVPTVFLERGAVTSLREAMSDWPRAVVKPAISAGSYRTIRVDDPAAGEEHLRALLRDGDAMVQPYVESVETHGERSIVWIDGAVTHAVRKSPRFVGDDERVSGALEPTAAERALAEAAVAAAPGPLLYARVDVAPDARGRLMVMEFEAIEPSLFLSQSEAALERLAGAIHRLHGLD